MERQNSSYRSKQARAARKYVLSMKRSKQRLRLSQAQVPTPTIHHSRHPIPLSDITNGQFSSSSHSNRSYTIHQSTHDSPLGDTVETNPILFPSISASIYSDDMSISKVPRSKSRSFIEITPPGSVEDNRKNRRIELTKRHRGGKENSSSNTCHLVQSPGTPSIHLLSTNDDTVQSSNNTLITNGMTQLRTFVPTNDVTHSSNDSGILNGVADIKRCNIKSNVASLTLNDNRQNRKNIISKRRKNNVNVMDKDNRQHGIKIISERLNHSDNIMDNGSSSKTHSNNESRVLYGKENIILSDCEPVPLSHEYNIM